MRRRKGFPVKQEKGTLTTPTTTLTATGFAGAAVDSNEVHNLRFPPLKALLRFHKYCIERWRLICGERDRARSYSASAFFMNGGRR